MNDFTTSLAMWLADYFLLSTILLLVALATLALVKQPAGRLAVTKSAFVALLLLAALCALPGWSLVHLMSRPEQPRPNVSPAAVNQVELQPTPEPIAASIQINDDVPAAEPPAANAVAPTRPPFWKTLSWTTIFASLYVAGSLCVFSWLCLGNLAARRLIRFSSPAPDSLSNLLTDLAGSQYCNARLLLSEKIDVAVAIGILRPAILLPQALAISSSPLGTRHSPLRTILAHELAHITAHDLHWLAVSRSLLVLLWPQPLFWLLRRQMRLDQEALADAAAAELTSRHTYAEQLVAWARQLPAHPAPRLSAAVGLWESPSQLRQRIALLVDEHFTVLRNCPRSWRFAASALAVLSAFALSLVTLAAPEPLAEPTDTPQTSIFQHGNERLGVLPKAIFDARPAVVWKRAPEPWQPGSDSIPSLGGIAVQGETGFSSDGFGRLFAFDVATGNPTWTFKTKQQDRTQPPLVVDATVYYTSGDGVVALARDSGKEIWKYDVPGGAAECSPIVVDGKLFVTGYDGVMRALNASNGDLVWERELLSDAPDVSRGPKGTDARLDGTKARPGIPASDGKAIYQPIFDQMRLVAVDCATGKVLWSFETRGWMHGHPTVKDGRVYVGSQDNFFYAIDATTGKQIWKFPTASRVEAGAALYNDWLYFGCCAGNVYCVDAKSGGEIWRFALDKRNGRSPIYCAPLVTPEGDLYIAGMEGQVYCLDAIGGTLRWKVRPSENSEIDSDLATDGKRLFITTRPDNNDAGESTIFALGPAELATAQPVAATSTTPTPAPKPAPEVAPGSGIPRPVPNSILGRATDENNRPIGGAEAVLFRVNQRDYARSRVAETTTDMGGNFRFDNIVDIAKEFPAGFSDVHEIGDELLQVVVRAPGRVSSARLEPRPMIAQQGNVEMLRMATAATLRGRVTGPDGKPVAGALVTVGNSPLELAEGMNSARTDADGNYEINDVAPFDIQQHREMEARQQRQMVQQLGRGSQTYALFVAPPMLTIEHPNFATKKTAYEQIPGTTDVRLDPPAVVEGRVVYAATGQPAADVSVHATTSRTTVDRQKGADPYAHLATQTRTNADGRYRFATLRAGSYDLWAEADGWLNAGASQLSAVAEKTTPAPDLVLVKGGTIRVRLVDAKSRESIKLRAGARAFMNAMPKTIIGARRIYNSSIEPQLDGTFELRALPGRNSVSVFGVVDGEISWTNDSSVNKSPPEVDVAEGQVADIDVALQKQDNTQTKANTFVAIAPAPPRAKPAAAAAKPKNYTSPITVTGRALDEAGKPIAGANIYLASPRTTGRPLAVAKTDELGAYRFENVDLPIRPADTNRDRDIGSFEVFGTAEGYAMSWRPVKWFFPKSEHAEDSNPDETWDLPDRFGRGDTIELDLRFGPPATIRGRIVNDKGEPIPGASLAIRRGQPLGDDRDLRQLESFNWGSLVPASVKLRRADGDGRFEFTGLPADHQFWIDIRPPGYTPQDIYAATRKLSDDEDEVDGRRIYSGDFEIVFRQPRTMKFRIVEGNTGQPAAKVGLAGQTILETTKDDGVVTIRVPDGTYQFDILPRWRTPFLRTSVEIVVSEETAREVKTLEIPPAAVAEIVVIDADALEPLAGVDVWRADAAEPERREVHGYRSWEVETRISHFDRPRTDENGKMQVFFEPGRHRIGVGLDAFPSGYEPVETNGKTVELEAGQTQTIGFQLRKRTSGEAQPTVIDAIRVRVDPADKANGAVPDSKPAKPAKDAEDKPVDIPVIVAKHVLLHEGKIIEWADVEKLVAALPNPKLARPGFYFTTGAIEPRQEEIRAKIWDFRRRQPLAGHTWGGIQARTSLRYDAVRTAADLEPNKDWRITGSVESADGLPIVGAQVVLVTPVDESLSYKDIEIYIRDRQLQQPFDEVYSTSDNNGRFALYPPPGKPHNFIALHKDGFGLVRGDDKSNRIVLQPWANLGGYLDRVVAAKWNGDDTWTIPATEKSPQFALHVENGAEETPGERGAAAPVETPDPNAAADNPAAEVQLARPAAVEDLTVTEKPDRITIGNHFILCRVTTDGQRQLLGWTTQPATIASLCLLVNYAAFENGPIDAQSPAFVSLAGALARLAKEDDRLLRVRVLTKPPQGVPFTTTDNRAEAIGKVCEQLGRTAGYKRTRASRSFGDYDWPAFAAKAGAAADNATSTDESVIGNSLIRVFPVRTFLSRTEADANADCVVEILPVIHQNREPRFPDDFLAAMHEFVPQIEYESRTTIMIRLSYTKAAQKQVEDWVRDESARKTLAKELGFQDCTVSQSQSGESEDTPAGEITGQVLNPDGTPAAKIRVMAIAGMERGFLRGQTDDTGHFKFQLTANEEALLFIQPQDYCQQTHFIEKRRGDLGSFKLEDGVQIHGRVVDTAGKPLPGVWVNASPVRGFGRVPKHLAISEQIHRSSKSDAQGRFKLAPLPPAAYYVVPQTVNAEPLPNREPSPLPAAFVFREFDITAANELDDIELRAVPSVVVTLQFVDSNGKPAPGFSSFFFSGRMIPEKKSTNGLLRYFFPQSATPPKQFHSTAVSFDQQGKAVVHAPVGMADAQIQIPYSGLSIRHRTEPGGPLSKNLVIELGKLDRDRQIEIIRYKPPVLFVDVKENNALGKRPPSVKVSATYTKVDAVQGTTSQQYVTRDVDFDEQPDGRWKSGELLPDEEFKLTVTAEGYEPYEETRSLAEGKQANVSVIFQKPPTAEELAAREEAIKNDPAVKRLKEMAEATAPLVASMTKDHGYSLAPDQIVKRIAPPIAPVRTAYYRTANPAQSEAMPMERTTLFFRWVDGKLESRAMSFGEPDQGVTIQNIASILLNVDGMEIDGDRELLRTHVVSDWLVRDGAPTEKVVERLQAILRDELSLPIKLEFRDVPRPAYVARGTFRLTPISDQGGQTVVVGPNKRESIDRIEVFARRRVPDLGLTVAGQQGDLRDFLTAVSQRIQVPIIAEVETQPQNVLMWQFHQPPTTTRQEMAEERNPQLILDNIAAQTGLTFTREERPVRILFIERK